MTLAHQNQNAVAVTPDAAPVAHHQQSSGVTDLVAWAHQYDAAYRFASGISNSAFVPAAYKGKPEEAAAAMLAGAELGFSPMTSLRAFDHIQGVTAPKAMTMRAVAQSRGHELWMVESTDERCVVNARRKGSDQIITVEWTIERATRLGLTNKDQWRKQPKAMLVARAYSEASRLVASDALLGIPYAIEEIRDDPNLSEAHPDERDALPSPRTAARGATRTSAAALTGEAATIEAVPASTSQQPVAQRKASLADVKAAFDAAGVNSREGVTRVVSQLLDRDVTDLRTLTAVDCEEVLGQATDLGADGLAALATGGQQGTAQAASDDYDSAEDHASLFADESGEQ